MGRESKDKARAVVVRPWLRWERAAGLRRFGWVRAGSGGTAEAAVSTWAVAVAPVPSGAEARVFGNMRTCIK
jgi:hypothetical protein